MRELLWESAARSTVILLVAAVVAWASRRASADLRHRVWASALLGLLALPIAFALAPAWRLAVLPPEGRPSVPKRPAPVAPSLVSESPAAPSPEFEQPSRISTEVPAPPVRRPAPDAWATLYVVGLAASLLPVAAGLAVNAGRRRRSRPAGAEWRELAARLGGGRADLRIGDGATIPATWGAIRPVVLLPAEADSWPGPMRTAVLAHELAHVRRRDWPVHLACRLAASAFWFQPLVWYALRRLRAECEHACDDLAVASGLRATDYAAQLLDLARRLRRPRLGLAVGMARSASLDGRMNALFDETRDHAPLGRRGSRGLLAASGLVLLAAATVRLGPRAAAAAEPASAERGPAVTVVVQARQDGRPVAKARVSLDGRDLVADEDGRATFSPVAPGLRWVDAAAAGFADVSRDVQVAGDQPVELVFRLVPGADLEGVVRDPSGRPVPEAEVSFGQVIAFPREDLDLHKGRTRSDAEGRYRLASVPRGVDLGLAATKAGFLMAAEMTRVDRPLGTQDLVMVPEPPGGVAIDGLVVDDQGRPVADAEVAHRSVGGEVVRARTDPGGRFTIQGLRRDGLREMVVWARAKDFAPAKAAVEDVPVDGRVRPTLRLARGHTVEARVEDVDGRSLAGVRVATHAYGPFDVETTTDEQGRFRFDLLPEADPQPSFQKPGYRFAHRRKVEPGVGKVLGYVMEPAGSLQGRVVDAKTGRPIDLFRVNLDLAPSWRPGGPLLHVPPDWIPGRSIAAGDGRFRVDDLAAGSSVLVKVSAPGYAPSVLERIVDAESESRDEVVRLAALDPASDRVYAGRLVGPDGLPLAGLRVWLLAVRPHEDPLGSRDIDWWGLISASPGTPGEGWRSWRYREAKTDEQGRFRFPDVAGDAQVCLFWWGARDASPGAAEHLERLDEAGRGLLLLEARAAARLVVEVEAALADRPLRLEAAPVGFLAPIRDVPKSPADPVRFEAEGLTPGGYELRLVERVPGAAPRVLGRRQVELKPGGSLLQAMP